jgi:hypothetical protein
LAAEAAEKVGKADPERTKHPTKRDEDASRGTRRPLGMKKTKGLSAAFDRAQGRL